MRYRVTHVTTYAYGEVVDLAGHLLHLTPRALPGQVVLAAALAANPAPVRTRTGADHFGNDVTWMFVETPHDRFTVTLEAEVEAEFAPPPAAEATMPWERVAAIAQRPGGEGWRAAEFACGSAMAPEDDAAGAYARVSFPAGRPILAALLDLQARIKRDFTFRTGVTTVSTPIAQVLAARAGVCQDFAHVMIAGLRRLGLPARYVSGYVRTRPRPGQKRRQGADQSHAWVGAWLGPGHGWVDLDPTNDIIVAEEHVVLGWGRDYADVSPLRGVLLGGGAHALSVSVDLDPMQEEFAT
jgi:transglutaminase-like putative cysteine protease